MCRIRSLTIWASTLALVASVAVAVSAQGSGKPLKVLRYRDPSSQVHAYVTAAGTEPDQPLQASFVRESVPQGATSSPAFYVYTEQYSATIPIYRFLQQDNSMLFAANDHEREDLIKRGLQELDPVFVYSRQVEGASEIFRVANPANGDIVHTTSPAERDFYLKRGWVQRTSLGYAQATLSSGTGILLPSTIKLDEDDARLIVKVDGWGKRIVFSRANAKIASLEQGSILYSEKSKALRLGLVARVTSISRDESGATEVQTAPVNLLQAFSEVHLYIENKPVYFFVPDAPASSAADVASTRVTDGEIRPEYLSEASAEDPAITPIGTLPDGAEWGLVDEPYNATLYSHTVGSTQYSLGVSGNLTITATTELIYNAYNACVVNPTITFILTPQITGTVNVNASVDTGISQDDIEVLGPFTGSVDVAGIPISVELDLYAGYSVSSELSATATGSVQLRMSGEALYNLNTKQFSFNYCMNPCPSGFSCGDPPATGATCTMTPSFSTTFGQDINASVYLKPEIWLYVGTLGSGIGPDVYAKFELQSDLTPTQLVVDADLIPGVGAKLETCGIDLWNVAYDFPPFFTDQIDAFPLVTAPTATTGSASSITTNSVTLNGSVNPNGADTHYYFTYGTGSTLSGATQTTSLDLGSGTTAVGVSATPTGLSAGTLYYFRVVAQNSSGTTNGTINSFTTTSSSQAPAATTGSAGSITTNSATLNGSVNPNGTDTHTWFLYGTSSTLSGATQTTSLDLGSGTTAIGVSATPTGLSAGTLYYFRVVAQNSSGTTNGTINSFTTTASAQAPAATTGSAGSITTNSATLNGSVNPNGTDTHTWFLYGTSSTLSGATQTTSLDLGSGTTAIGVSATPTGLSAGTLYYFRVVAQNSSGTTNGTINSFTTTASAQAPTATTGLASSVTTNSATLGGTVNPNGADTHSWFLYGTSSTLSGANQTPSQDLGSGTTASGINANIAALSANTQYYFEVVAQNSSGTTTGAIISFVTIAAVQNPTVTTGSASSVTANSASLSGTVNPNGADTHAQFQYGTSSTLSGASQTPLQDLGSGTTAAVISANISGLSAGTLYYYRVTAGNSAGTGNGNINSFTTTTAAKTTPTVTVTPSELRITTTQALSVAISVSGNPIPTGTVTLVGGTFSGGGTLVNGSATITIPAAAFAVGTDQLTATYQGDNNYYAQTGTNVVYVTAIQVSCSSYSSTKQIAGITQPLRLGMGNSTVIVSSVGQSYIVDPISDQITTVPFTSYSGGIGGRVSVHNSQAFIPISNLSQGEVAVLNLGNFAVSGYYPVGTEPYASLVVGSQLYIGDMTQWSNGNPSQVYDVNPASGQIFASINAGHVIESLVSDSAHNRIYALNYNDSTASAIDIPSNTVTSTINLAVMPTAGIVSNDTLLVVGDLPSTQNGNVVEVNTASNTVESTISVGRDPRDIVGVNSCAFIPNQSDYTVSVLDLAANAIVKTISSGIGSSPTGVVADPSTGYVYVANQTSNSISVLKPSSTTTPTVTVVPTPTSITTAQQLSVAVTVNATTGNPTPTGTVTLTIGSYTSQATPLTNGSATIIISAGVLTVGSNQTLTATYTPDSNSSSIYNSASGSNPVTVTSPAKTIPTVTVTPSPSSVATTQPLTVTVTVAGTPRPTGSVTLSGGGYTSAATTLTGGSATITIPAGSLSTGTDTLTASYTPDSNSSSTYNSGSGSNSVTVTSPAKTTPTVTVTPSPSSVATTQPLTVTVTVAGTPRPTGSVTLSGGGYTSAVTTLSGGSAQINVPAGSLSTGTDTLTASYTPDSNSSSVYNSASGSNTVTVTTPTKTTPTVTVTPSPSSITTVQALSVTVTMAGTPTPTGSVTLTGGGYTSAVTTLSGGSAQINVPAGSLSTGTDTLTASYTPDSNSSSVYNSASGSNTVTVTTPTKTTPTVTVTPSPSSITTVQALSVTVTMAGTPTPTGSVTLTGGGYTSAVTTLSGGSAQINIPAGSLSAGTDTLTVSYTPDSASAAIYNSATGTSSAVSVTLATQTITFPAISAQTVGKPLTLSATASSGLAVTFTSTTTSICTVSGTAATFIASGTCTIDANQSGNSTYAAASTVPQSFTVNAEAQTITFANPGTQTVGTPLTLSATATSGLGVTFTSTTTGVCMVSGTTATFIASGTCTIDANQVGNNVYAAAPQVQQSFIVNAAPTFTGGGGGGTISIEPGATKGNTVTISVTPSNGFTGTVNLSCSISPTAASDPATCSFAPSSVTISGSTAQTSTLTINTTASTKISGANQIKHLFWPATGGTTFAVILLFGIPRRRRNWVVMLVVLVLFVSCGAMGCVKPIGAGSGGGSGNAGTTPGTYTVTVTGTSGSSTVTLATVTLVVQ
jgi:phosphodiesterase/alkaline phosphatase D-like protein